MTHDEMLDELEMLVFHIADLGQVMDYFGGFGEAGAKGRQLIMFSSTVKGWIEEMKPKFTPWFDMTDPPAMVGWYQTAEQNQAMVYFDGEFWREYPESSLIIISPFKWRGLEKA